MDNNTKEQILSDNLGMQYHSATSEQLSLYHQVMDQYAAQVLQNKDPWISVKDRLPENGIRVLAWEGTIAWEAYIRFDGKWEWSHVDGDLHPTDYITHWMPFPNKPKS